MNPKCHGTNGKKRPAPPRQPLTEGKVRNGVKPQGPRNEVIKTNKFDWYCFGLGFVIATSFWNVCILLWGAS